MPRTGRRRSLITAAAFIATLAAPAAAQAATYSVKAGNGPCGGADLLCGSLAEAATAAAAGDVFNVDPGTYGSATFDVPGVTITGAPTFNVDGSLAFTGDGAAPAKLEKVLVRQPNGTAAAVISDGSAGLQISDAVIFGDSGDGVNFSDGTANKIVRSVIASGGSETAGVHFTVGDLSTADKALLIESSILSGGLAGVSINTGNGNGLVSNPGDVALTMRHVTTAGATHGVVLDASKANPLIGGPAGSITASFTDSLIQKQVFKKNYTGVLTGLTITAPPNTVTDSYLRSPVNVGDDYFVDASKRNFRLRAGSPAIDVGGFTEGESATDFEGNARPGPTTDLGGDEYVAPAPPPAPPPPPAPGASGDGDLPKVVITSPTQNQRVRLTTKTTRTVTVTRNGKRVKVKRTTTKKNKVVFKGTATDKSGVAAVALFVERLSDTGTSPSATPGATVATKCKWLNGTKGIVSKSCAKPILLVAKLAADGTWSYTVKPRIGAGRYRIIVLGGDKAGGRGNSATPAEAIHRFTLLK